MAQPSTPASSSSARGIDDARILQMPRCRELEQHQLDLIGLGLVALAAFFAFVFYLGWDGGKVGERHGRRLRLPVRRRGYLAPVALFGAGAVLVLRPMLPSVQPVQGRARAASSPALMLGLAARLVRPRARPMPRARASSTPHYFRHHGGLVGEPLFWVTQHAVLSSSAPHIIFLFLMFGGLLLLTGASVAG